MTRHLARARPGAFTRVRAVLAGALVLGVGAAMTLASWTDSENATSSTAFTASTFNIESSLSTANPPPSATGWSSNTSLPGALLVFSATSAMSPEVSSYSTLNIRTTSATNVAGVIALSSSTITEPGTINLGPQLEYRIVAVSTSTTCGSGVFTAGAAYSAGGFTTYQSAGSIPVSPPTVALNLPAGSAFRYCFDVRIKTGTPNSFQGGSAKLTWTFTATSNS